MSRRPGAVAFVGLVVTVLGGLVVLGAAACSPETSSEGFDLSGPKPDGGTKCTAGQVQDCVCLGGGQGVQTCRATGSSFGVCTGCSTGTDGPATVVADMGGSPCGDCDGCCDGTLCVPFASETTMRCGFRGQSCAACGGTKICSTSNGSCVDSGPGCASCPYGVTCVSNACTNNIDPNSYFKVIVKSVRLTAKAPDGSDWDGFFDDDPEPQACFYYQSGGTIYKGCSDYVSSSNNGTSCDGAFDATTGLVKAGGMPFLLPGSALIAGTVHAVGQDNDSGVNPTGDDVAADFPISTSTLHASYSTGAHGNVIDIVFELH